jgi:predicted nucleotidyltransferase component of viral defense system
MNLFDKLVTEALKQQTQLTSLRAVVEKELLHHDILLIMRDYDFFADLTFIGGTCLRLCYGGARRSEDLDFTGGAKCSRGQ